MRRSIAGIIVGIVSFAVLEGFSQEFQQAVEQSLERETAEGESNLPEEDGLWQQWDYLGRHRVNINRADEDALVHLLGFSTLQALQFTRYRRQFGALVDLMELQAVPGLDIETIRRILPYIEVAAESRAVPLLRERMTKGEHTLLMRGGVSHDRFLSGITVPSSAFAGNNLALLLRYAYRFRNLLQWGITLEKDAGEKFFPGGIIRGPEFWTMHLSVRSIGNLRALVLGDYHINLGQGLIHWQGMAFRKGASGIMIHRQALRLRPYNGTDENRFHRGLGIDIGKQHAGILLFAAKDRMDGNRAVDSTNGDEYAISSIQWSGLHRTASEIEDKNSVRQRVLGASLYWQKGLWKLAWNGISHWFAHRLQKGDDPYQRYNLSGSRWVNHSIDYGGTIRNVYVFGEIAQAGNGSIGFLQGMMISIDPRLDLALVGRHFPPRYRAMQANAFTELSSPGNESGLYAALSFRPANAWRVDAWMDFYRFPWLRFRVDRPSAGRDIQLNLSWKPGKTMELTQRFLAANKETNPPDAVPDARETGQRRQIQYRIQFSLQPNRFILVRHRLDLNQVSHGGQKDRGVLMSMDITYKSPQYPVSLSTRVSWFQADNYDARLYQFERDVLYSFAMYPFYRRGTRFYVLLESRFFKSWRAWVKLSSTLFNDNQLVNADNGAPQPFRKMALRIQFARFF